MKNGRNRNNNSGAGKPAGSVANGSESSDAKRSDFGTGESDTREAFSDGNESIQSVGDDTPAKRTDSGFTLPSGYYFTPNGDVERIPTGYAIRNGRLYKPRQRRNDSAPDYSANGDENRNRAEAGSSAQFPVEVPLWIESKGKRKTKKVTESQQRTIMVTMLAMASSAIFTSVSLLTKHDHWPLVADESEALAKALNSAFETLPSKYYEFITAIIEKWVPWVQLAFVTGAIIIPRIEETRKRIEAVRYQSNQGNHSGNAGAEVNSIPNAPSAFYNH